MKLSRQEEIALLLTSELASRSDSYVSLSDIAQKHGISILFLKKIARMLKKQELLLSKEGLNGGYTLGKSAHSISAWQVMEAVSGRINDRDLTNAQYTCPLRPVCMPQTIRHLISEACKTYLSDITIDQLIKKQQI